MRVVQSFVLASALLLAVSAMAAGATLTAPQTTVAPVIDGELESAWNQAVVLNDTNGWETNQGLSPDVATKAQVMWNDDYLFIAFVNMQDMSAVTANITDRDGPVHQDDDNEVFIAPDWPNLQPYYQFVTNSNAAQFDGVGTDPSWSAEWQVAVQRQADRWTAEIAIPWSSIELTPSTGSALGFNVTRHWIAGNQWITWTPGLSSFHSPALFSTLILGD